MNRVIEIDSSEIPNTPEKIILEAEMQVTPEQWKTLDKEETTSVKRSVLFNQGYQAGFSAAADDYCNEKVNLSFFEKMKEARDVTDFYVIGFETGYFRKLAEILVF